MTFTLLSHTPVEWVTTVLGNLDSFLNDHASAEKKASGMAMAIALHYPDKPDIVEAMIDLAIEELAHFREVVKIMASRKLQLQPDNKDPYVNQLNRLTRRDSETYMLDRLILGSVIEARGAERFGLVANALPAGKLKRFYQVIAGSEDKHQELFLKLAENYFAREQIEQRLGQILSAEAEIMLAQPIRPVLH